MRTLRDFHEGEWLKQLVTRQGPAISASRETGIHYSTLTRAFNRRSLSDLDPSTFNRLLRYLGMNQREWKTKLEEERHQWVYGQPATRQWIQNRLPPEHQIDNSDITFEPSVPIKVFDRNVAAGSFSLVDSYAEPDGIVPVPRALLPLGVDPLQLFILSIHGDSMMPKFKSGDRLIMEWLQLDLNTMRRIKVGGDYCVCQKEDGCSFKALVGIDPKEPSLLLAARNTKQYPDVLRVPWVLLSSIARHVGRINITVEAD